MSTTVTYKGDTLATVSNATKTLKTAGKYMEGDVTLTDVSRAAPTIQSLSVTPSESAQTFNASGVDGYKPVSVGAISSTYVGSGIHRIVDGDITYGVNGNYYKIVTNAGYDNVGRVINVPLNSLSNPSISIDENGLITSTLSVSNGPYKAQTVTATKQLTLHDSTDLTVSGATVTAPAGYYAEAASKSVTTMTLPTSTAASATSGYASKATVGRSTSDQYINIAPGYNSAGGYYKINAVANGSLSYSDWTETESDGVLTMTIGKYFVAGYLSSAPDIKRTFTSIIDTTITPSTTQQVVSRQSGNTFIKRVTVEAMPSGSATAPASISGTAATVSTGTNTLTLTKTVSVTPTVTAGYVSAGTAGNSSVSLTASVTTQAAKTVTPTESSQIAVAANVYTTGAITVGAISSTYVGSGVHTIDPEDSSDVYIKNWGHGEYAVEVPEGYTSGFSYYLPCGDTRPAASITGTSATITTGTNTITLTKTVSNTPQVTEGYVAAGTTDDSSVSLTASVTVNPTPTASGATVTIPAGYYSSQTTKSVTSGSASAPSTISGTSATVSTGTNTLTLTKTISVTPTVSAGYVSAGTATNSSVSLTASVTTKAAATITPTTTNQTIASGTYLTGTQTIAGDADLVASNIINGVQIFGVTGNVVLQNYYTGSSAPSSSLGQNGDIYIQQ